MGDAEIESMADQPARVFELIHIAKVMPEAEGQAGQQHAAFATALILHLVVTGGKRLVAHVLSKSGDSFPGINVADKYLRLEKRLSAHAQAPTMKSYGRPDFDLPGH